MQQATGRTARKPRPFTGIGAVITIVLAAAALATLFTMWSPASFFSMQDMEEAIDAWQPVPNPTDLPSAGETKTQIALVAGHWGSDNGAICADGLTEQSVNLDIATRVQQLLVKAGYQVDLFKEFDDGLKDYSATALVSLHSGSCDYIDDAATGFKLAMAAGTTNPERAARLVDCMADRYGNETKLEFLSSQVTEDMTQYHTFNELNENTPAVILDMGFLNLDRELLTSQPDKVAQGIYNGIRCYIRNEPAQ
ncbi:MAG TPA: N-acetylmuramoyl-L-alanine amidase [Bellilinea sp.]|nr:N-acetylmuramoyl-L-alanine amidase [Bellilinea sp.]